MNYTCARERWQTGEGFEAGGRTIASSVLRLISLGFAPSGLGGWCLDSGGSLRSPLAICFRSSGPEAHGALVLGREVG
jgi:hypothetical protein